MASTGVINLTNSVLSIALNIVSETASLNDLYLGYGLPIETMSL